MKKKLLSFLYLSILFIHIFSLTLLTAPLKTQGVTMDQMRDAGLGEIGETAFGSETPQTSVPEIVAKIIKFLLTFLGIIFMILILYGGFLWMTAGGNEDNVTKSKTIIKNGTIGLLIILSSYAITYFIIEKFVMVTSGG